MKNLLIFSLLILCSIHVSAQRFEDYFEDRTLRLDYTFAGDDVLHQIYVDELVSLQQRILDCSADYVRPGGILVYSTCTLNRKENENQVRDFLRRHPGFVLNREKTCLPQELDSDGFYMAQLTRNS